VLADLDALIAGGVIEDAPDAWRAHGVDAGAEESRR
jgi:hypothetical protein